MAAENNLIQVQSELQSPTVRDTDLIKYANGGNPSVPSFLALMEMNRRKQLEEGSKAYEASNQKTIKDQLANALTAPTQFGGALTGTPVNQVNPAAAPTGISVGSTPANQVNPTAAPPEPGSGAITVGAAEGGLMSLPIAHFNENSYAGGGIVAFGTGDLVSEEKKLSSFPEARSSGSKVLSDAAIEDALRAATQPTEEQVTAAAAPAAKGYQGILDSLPKVKAPTEKSLEELYAERKAVEKLAGVSDDPYSEAKKRMAAMEERQAKENEGAGLDRLIAQMSAFSKADPSKGFGYAAGISADASRAAEKEQRALVEKQETAQIEFAKAVAKEEDARRHKDADGVLAAQQAQQEAALKYQKAEHDRGMLAAHIYQTDEYAATRRQNAALAAENKPSAEDKKLLKVQTTVNGNPVVKSIADAIKQGTIEIGSEEYYRALRKINEIAKPLYEQAGLPLPADIIGDVNEAPIKKPGLFERIFGDSKAPAANTIPKGWTVQTNP